MQQEDIVQGAVPVDRSINPVKISGEDIPYVQEIQALVDSLSRYRQELGRLFQVMGNLQTETNRLEEELNSKRMALSTKYQLDKTASGQWAIDFETKEFVKTSPSSPVIP